MDLSELSVIAIKSLLAEYETVPEELLGSLSADPRQQVQALAGRIRRAREHALEQAQTLERMLERERRFHERGCRLVAGVDEVGRGPLAGPVVAAAVIFEPGCAYPAARDSKTLPAQAREELYQEISEKALAVGLGRAEHGEIDRLNIHNASLLAMYRAVQNLTTAPQALLVDGRMVLRLDLPQEAVIGGDGSCLSVAAASIVAKVTRDRLMCEFDRVYPGYGFARHKGYPTEDHVRALRELGPCPIHRRSFATVASLGSFGRDDWPAFFDQLNCAASLEELETVAGRIKPLAGGFTPEELASLRALYRRRRDSLKKGQLHLL
ncbi:MAG: ribonuclease HII [Candidatus Glassbacteria bacterium]